MSLGCLQRVLDCGLPGLGCALAVVDSMLSVLAGIQPVSGCKLVTSASCRR